jgi:transposase
MDNMKVTLMKVHKRMYVIQSVDEGHMTAHQASLELGLSVRQIRRLISTYRQEGAVGLVHGNRDKPSPRRLSSEQEQQIITLIKQQFRDYNTLHLLQELQEQFALSISYTSLYRLRLRAHLLSPRTRRAPKHRSRREPKLTAGAMLQTDASTHDWLEGRGPHLSLVVYIDDATNEIVGAVLREQEDATGYMLVLRNICLQQGIPLSIYADRHTIFQSPATPTVEQSLKGEEPLTQFGRTLKQLDIRLIPALSPQAKGRVERLFETLQDRLVKFLRTHKVCTCQEANLLLPAYLELHNARFMHPPVLEEVSYRPWPKDFDPDAIFCFQYQRTVAGDNTITFDGSHLQIPPGPSRRSYAHARVDVRLHLQGHLTVHYQNEQIASFMPLDNRPVRVDHFTPAIQPKSVEVSSSVSLDAIHDASHPKYKPAPNHPWRRIPINPPGG